jgi:hypothetical protein
MALNLSTLTSPATSGNVLEEVTTTADFLESVPVLRNLARGTNAGGDAKQSVALNQPKALPLIDGDGYLYCSGINGNYAQTPDDSSLDITGDFVIDVDVTMKSWTPTASSSFCGKYLSTGDQRSFRFLLRPDKRLQLYFSDDGTAAGLGNAFSTEVPFTDGQRGQVRLSFNSSNGIVQFFTSTDKGATWTQLGPDRSTGKFAIYGGTADVYIGSYFSNSELVDDAAIHSVKFYDSVTPSSSSLRFNCDFTATNVRHGDTKFTCATGQTVTINQDSSSSNDVATIIKKPVLRFDGVNDFMDGVFGQTITDGYMFAAFSVLGGGGETYGRVFSVNPTGVIDSASSGFIYSLRHDDTSPVALGYYHGGTYSPSHLGLFDDANGDILHEVKSVDGAQFSKVNNADNITTSLNLSAVASQEFSIANYRNSAIDLEYLALFPATITDDQADQIRNYINNRNNVFYRWDTDGYYFFDGAATDDGQVFTGSGSWNGRIVGSDNGDADMFIGNGTAADRPTTDGYKITFADNTDHFDIPSTTQAGWQVVGTSLGTFAYKVNANAVTELNLLGNLGHASYRKAGDLYGIILLPESATNRDIEEARKLLIDRGAADASTITSAGAAWFRRYDIVEFRNAEFPDAITLGFAFEEATNLSKIDTVNAPVANNFSSTWQNCSALTSFPADAKLGTEVTGYVNFTRAWQDSGLQSFPALDLSKGDNFQNAWFGTPMQSFPADIKLGTAIESGHVTFVNTWRATNLTSFPALDFSKGGSFHACWYDSDLTQFPSGVSMGTDIGGTGVDLSYTWALTPLTSFPLINFGNVYTFNNTWRQCTQLVDFPAGFFDNWSPTVVVNQMFLDTWLSNNSLSSTSVENILTSIATSGVWATNNGTSGGTPISGPEITIDYNASTGSLTADTLSAIETLNGRGWSVNINGVIQ